MSVGLCLSVGEGDMTFDRFECVIQRDEEFDSVELYVLSWQE